MRSLHSRLRGRLSVLALLINVTAGVARAQTPAPPAPPADEPKARLELYGYVMVDTGFEIKQSHPNFFDSLRPSSLPKFENEFGEDGRFFASVRQSRFGARTFSPTALGELRTMFEIDLYGSGVDEGQTTFRMRHAYGEIGAFGAGHTFSPFMDVDAFPVTLDFWGPVGTIDFRNVQVRWMPIRGATRLTLAIERPGGSGDDGRAADRIEVENVRARFPLPDFSAEYRVGRPWGYVEAAGVIRRIQLDDPSDGGLELDQSIVGWGISLSSNLRPSPSDRIRLQTVFGAGVQNRMNDPSADVAPELTPGSSRPVKGKALPLASLVAFLEHQWNDRWSTTVGYSLYDIDNSNGQNPDAYSLGHYATGSLLFTPVKDLLVGGELQYGRRENFSDGFRSDDVRIQFTFKYDFLASIGRQ